MPRNPDHEKSLHDWLLGILAAANCGTPGAQACLDYRANVPTKANLRSNFIYNIVPRSP